MHQVFYEEKKKKTIHNRPLHESGVNFWITSPSSANEPLSKTFSGADAIICSSRMLYRPTPTAYDMSTILFSWLAASLREPALGEFLPSVRKTSSFFTAGRMPAAGLNSCSAVWRPLVMSVCLYLQQWISSFNLFTPYPTILAARGWSRSWVEAGWGEPSPSLSLPQPELLAAESEEPLVPRVFTPMLKKYILPTFQREMYRWGSENWFIIITPLKLKKYILSTFWRNMYKWGSENWSYNHRSSE